MKQIIFLLSALIVFFSCNSQDKKSIGSQGQVIVGAERVGKYLPMIKNRRVAVIVNQTSLVKGRFLVDTLLDLGVKITKIFTPEHGLKGKLDRGVDYKQKQLFYRQIPVVSLIGQKKAPWYTPNRGSSKAGFWTSYHAFLVILHPPHHNCIISRYQSP